MMDTLTEDILDQINDKMEILAQERNALLLKKEQLDKLNNTLKDFHGMVGYMTKSPTIKLVTTNAKLIISKSDRDYSLFRDFIDKSIMNHVDTTMSKIMELTNEN